MIQISSLLVCFFKITSRQLLLIKAIRMISNTPLLLITFLFTLNVSAQQKPVLIFASGNEGYSHYRIPAMVALPGGKLLAFCEGRVHSAGDFGNIDIVMKTSNNKGKTWSALKIIVDADSLQAGNPAPVLDMADPLFPAGRLFLFYNTGNNHENEVRKGKGVREVWYKTSVDGGDTWSKPVNITLQVHRPNQPTYNSLYNCKEDWRSYANTPGHAMQFNSGKFKGRILVAANHSAGEPEADASDYHAHCFYTDDHGNSFKLGATVDIRGSNESMAAELPGDKLIMNSRNQKGDIKARIVSFSSDGGASWDTSYFDKALPDPINQGSILSLRDKNRKNFLAFCNAADTLNRNNLTLRISSDNGKTWKKQYSIDGDAHSKDDPTAYSDMTVLSEHSIGVIYERKGYSQIVFKAINWNE
ncbi:MAG: sialidase family protein [Agriterribacter sp.]